MRRALVVRHHVEDDAGLIARAFERRGFVLTTIMVDAHDHDLDAEGYDVVIVLGSNSAVYDPDVRAAWLDDELVALRSAHEHGTPMLGICFGAQVLCHLFGGTVERAARGEEGWIEIDVVEGCSLSTGPWFEYHGDHCVVPESATVLARSADAVQIFTVAQHVGVQFHPEIDAQQLTRWFEGENGSPRAHSPRQSALLEETRRHEERASVNAGALVDYFLDHAKLTT